MIADISVEQQIFQNQITDNISDSILKRPRRLIDLSQTRDYIHLKSNSIYIHKQLQSSELTLFHYGN